MLKKEVKIGSTYSAKVSNKLAAVKITAVHGSGWNATNIETGKAVCIKSAARLRACLDAPTTPDVAPSAPVAPATPAKATTAPKAAGTKKQSGLDLAAFQLAAATAPMDAKWIAEAVIAAGWKTKGKTPAATLYAAIVREIQTKGDKARFAKTARGHFEYRKPSAA